MNKIKENRAFSYIIITIIYILATIAVNFTYNALDFEWWLRLLIADVVATVVTFVFSVIPLADGRQSSKAGFNEYRSETRMLLPIKRLK